MYNNKITRDDFVGSRFLTIRLIDLEKSLIHRNKFVFEIVTDRSTQLSKKNYGELKRFTTELTNRFGMQQFNIQHHMRSSEQKKQLEMLFKKLNNGYLMAKDAADEGNSTKRNLIRNYLYNLFYNSIENPPSDEEESQREEIKSRKLSDTGQPSEWNQKKEERRHIEQDIWKEKQVKQQVSNTQISRQDKGIQIRYEKVREAEKQSRQDNNRSSTRKIFKALYRSKAEKQEQHSKSLFRGLDMIWVKEANSWTKKWISIENNMLALVNQQQKQIIILKQLQIIIAEEHYRRIQITHDLLAQPIELRLRDISDLQHDQEDLQDYVRLLTVFKETILTLSNYHDDVVNFVAIRITNKKNKFSQDIEKKPAKQLLFKIIHQTETQIDIKSQNIIHNGYRQFDSCAGTDNKQLWQAGRKIDLIKFEVIEERQAGIMPKFREYSIEFSLPVQNIYDQLFNQKPKKKATEMKYFILGSKVCNYSLKLEYFERANKWSYCSMRTEDRFEGEKPPVEFSRDEFRIQKNRFKRILYTIESYLNYLKALKNMEYPFQSYIFYFILTISILLFDNNYSLHYTFAILAAIMIYNHPNFSSYSRQIAVALHLNNYLDEISRKIKEQKGWGRPRVHFKKEVEKKRFLEQFKFTRKKQGSIVQKYQRLHLWLLRGQLVLTELVTLSEKIKNIFLWYHHRKTKQLFLLLLAVLAVIVFVPIKLLLLGAVYKMFRRGLNHRTRTRQINKYILMEIFQNLVEEFNLAEMKAYVLQPNKIFDRRSTQYLNFQRKIKEWLSVNLMIDIDFEIFNESRCMKDLIFHLSDCRKRFLIPEAVCRRYKFSLEWSHQKNTLTKIFKLIYGFIINIPSDRNILGTAYQQPDKDEGDSDEFQD